MEAHPGRADPLGSITALAIDPADSHVLYAAATNQGKAALWISRDSGDKWDQETTLTEPGQKIWVARESVYVAGASSIARRAGGKWERLPAPIGVRFTGVTANLPKIYGIAGHGFFVSENGGTTWSVTRLLGPQRALAWLMLGEAIDARAALEIGLIHRVVPKDALAGEVDALARRIASGPPIPHATLKRLIDHALTSSLDVQLDAERAGFVHAAGTADFREGVAAFLERRQPQFQGK